MRPKKPLLGALLATFTFACASGQGEPPAATAAATPASDSNAAPGAPAPSAAPAAPSSSAEAASATDEAPSGDPDTRTMEVIASIVKAHRKDARACYEKGQKQVAGLQGDLVVHFVLTPSGKVKVAELNRERSTITEPSVVSCVVDVVRAIEFPKSSRGMETTVNYPFNFTP